MIRTSETLSWAYGRLRSSGNFAEGVRSFVEKRKPKFPAANDPD